MRQVERGAKIGEGEPVKERSKCKDKTPYKLTMKGKKAVKVEATSGQWMVAPHGLHNLVPGSASNLREVLELEKKVQEKQLCAFNRKKAELFWALEQDDEEDSKVTFKKLPKKKPTSSKGKAKRVSDEWESLLNLTKDSLKSNNGNTEKNGRLPSFNTIKNMFADDEPPAEKKRGDVNRLDVRQGSVS